MRYRTRPSYLVLLLSSSLTVSSCSFVFIDGPPPRQERGQDFDCSTGYGVPAIDTAFSVLGLGFAAIGVTATTPGGLSPSTARVVSLSSAVVWGISAATGYGRVYACREALDERAPTPELPHHHRPPPPRLAPPRATAPAAPPVPQAADPTDAP